MELRVLRYFLAVAREGNITGAANSLHLSQPTLSRQMIQLEEELGVTLFRRSKHRIVLTEDGMLLRRRAEEIVSLTEKTVEDMQHKTPQLTGKLSIGSGEFKVRSSLQNLSPLFTACIRRYTLKYTAAIPITSRNGSTGVSLISVFLQSPSIYQSTTLPRYSLQRTLGTSGKRRF